MRTARQATFVNEFRKMLSEKLLASASHDTEKEAQHARAHAHATCACTCTCGAPQRSGAGSLALADSVPVLREVRNLELLKKRFGDAALSACEAVLP